jgi:hypothetical protein
MRNSRSSRSRSGGGGGGGGGGSSVGMAVWAMKKTHRDVRRGRLVEEEGIGYVIQVGNSYVEHPKTHTHKATQAQLVVFVVDADAHKHPSHQALHPHHPQQTNELIAFSFSLCTPTHSAPRTGPSCSPQRDPAEECS